MVVSELVNFKTTFTEILNRVGAAHQRLLPYLYILHMISVAVLHVGVSESSWKCRLTSKQTVIWQCCCRMCCVLELQNCVSKLSGRVSQFEQRANIKVLCKLGKSVSDMLQALQALCGANAFKKKRAVYDWSSCFRSAGK
jgi:hypothetical protein